MWGLKHDYRNEHPVIVEKTTGVVACGDSWCGGECGFPALVLGDLRAMGVMVAHGPVFQRFRRLWVGEKIEATPGDASTEDLTQVYWR